MKTGAAASQDRGTIKVESKKGHGAKEKVKYVRGGTGERINFGNILDKDYTVCSIDRYWVGLWGI